MILIFIKVLITSANSGTTALCEKCPNTEFFSGPYHSVFGLNTDLLRKSPYSVRIQKNADQKKLRIWALFTHHSVKKYLKRPLND